MCVGWEEDGDGGWVRAASSTYCSNIRGLCDSSVGELAAAPFFSEQEATKHRMASGDRALTGAFPYQDFTEAKTKERKV